ncbi:unnamed protein product [Amoebophrya sp. A120]|nr:unnamed protein product [Amoebophrya sp. A120]|eukprot:GSA120T00003975001.1
MTDHGETDVASSAPALSVDEEKRDGESNYNAAKTAEEPCAALFDENNRNSSQQPSPDHEQPAEGQGGERTTEKAGAKDEAASTRITYMQQYEDSEFLNLRAILEHALKIVLKKPDPDEKEKAKGSTSTSAKAPEQGKGVEGGGNDKKDSAKTASAQHTEEKQNETDTSSAPTDEGSKNATVDGEEANPDAAAQPKLQDYADTKQANEDEAPKIRIKFVNLAGDPLLEGDVTSLDKRSLRGLFLQKLHEATDMEDGSLQYWTGSYTDGLESSLVRILRDLHPLHPKDKPLRPKRPPVDETADEHENESTESKPQKKQADNNHTRTQVDGSGSTELYCKLFEMKVRLLDQERADFNKQTIADCDLSKRLFAHVWKEEWETDAKLLKASQYLALLRDPDSDADQRKLGAEEYTEKQLEDIIERYLQTQRGRYEVWRTLDEAFVRMAATPEITIWPTPPAKPNLLEVFMDIYGEGQVFVDGKFIGPVWMLTDCRRGLLWANEQIATATKKLQQRAGDVEGGRGGEDGGPRTSEDGENKTRPEIADFVDGELSENDQKATVENALRYIHLYKRLIVPPDGYSCCGMGPAFRLLHCGEDADNKDYDGREKSFLASKLLRCGQSGVSPACFVHFALTQHKYRDAGSDEEAEIMRKALQCLKDEHPNLFLLAPYSYAGPHDLSFVVSEPTPVDEKNSTEVLVREVEGGATSTDSPGVVEKAESSDSETSGSTAQENDITDKPDEPAGTGTASSADFETNQSPALFDKKSPRSLAPSCTSPCPTTTSSSPQPVSSPDTISPVVCDAASALVSQTDDAKDKRENEQTVHEGCKQLEYVVTVLVNNAFRDPTLPESASIFSDEAGEEASKHFLKTEMLFEKLEQVHNQVEWAKLIKKLEAKAEANRKLAEAEKEKESSVPETENSASGGLKSDQAVARDRDTEVSDVVE